MEEEEELVTKVRSVGLRRPIGVGVGSCSPVTTAELRVSSPSRTQAQAWVYSELADTTHR